jgi:hypothetical protein
VPQHVNPETAVIDAIGALVAESLLAQRMDDYNRPWTERCEHCHHQWHGLRCSTPGTFAGCLCPGAFATDEEIRAFKNPPLPDDIQVQRLRDGLADARRWREMNRQEIAAIYGIPAHLVGAPESAAESPAGSADPEGMGWVAVCVEITAERMSQGLGNPGCLGHAR